MFYLTFLKEIDYCSKSFSVFNNLKHMPLKIVTMPTRYCTTDYL